MKYVLLLLLFLNTQLFSHQTGLSYINIRDFPDTLEYSYKKPLSDINAKDLDIVFPSYCKTKKLTQTIADGYIAKIFALNCENRTLEGTRVWIKGLIQSDKGVIVRYENPKMIQKELLRDSNPFILINHQSSKLKTFTEYLNLGIFHIMGGYDHLLFVLSLIILSRNLKTLLYAVSAFTLSHSITLSSAVLGIVTLPSRFVESMIALSIVVLAREIATNSQSFTKRHIAFVAFLFGLLHGFGFSSVLLEIGIPQDEILLSLFLFNVGIEAGQILFILGVGIILFVLNKIIDIYNEKLKLATAYFIGSCASFWLIERALAL